MYMINCKVRKTYSIIYSLYGISSFGLIYKTDPENSPCLLPHLKFQSPQMPTMLWPSTHNHH